MANTNQSEDCLYLQVVRPVSRRMERIPVMVREVEDLFIFFLSLLDCYLSW